MCGIAGIYNYADRDHPVDHDLLVRMTRAIAHRGPDAEGFHLQDNLGFGHRRLSIVDLSITGAQPMSNADGSCWITYNGEFYNHREFRARLNAKGYRFSGSSDTETLLHLLESEGPDALVDVAGIFGFGFWNGRNQTLMLARDPLGVKQVYFHDNGRRIVFASEIKALLQDPGVPREPDPEAINQYLHFHTALFDRTFFKDIRQLRPGEYLQINRHGAKLRTYWSLKEFQANDRPTAMIVDELRDKLSRIVADQLMSDVPVGSFFSGGIDSTAVAAYSMKTGQRPACFGVHFSDQNVVDERPYQEAAAKALGLDLQLITLDGSTFPEDFRTLMYHQDEPVIGAAMFPMFKVSQLAARQVKVCLGGQAADEIFGGYARYALGHPAHVISSWFAGRQKPSSAKSTSRVGGNLARQFGERKTIFRLARNIPNVLNWESRYFEHFAKVPEAQWMHLFSGPEFCSRQRSRQLFQETVHRSAATDATDKIMHWEVQTYLPGLFHQDDRMSMAVGLESRVPFADPRLVRFAFGINSDLKLRAGASKWILRKAVSDILPELVLNRRKVGFDTPAEQWMKTHAGFVRETLLSSSARDRGMWNMRELETLLNHSGNPGTFDVLWKALSIEIWASTFLDEKPVEVVHRSSTPVFADLTPKDAPSRVESVRRFVREIRELGIKGTFARSVWEFKTRSGFVGSPARDSVERQSLGDSPQVRLPFADSAAVAVAMRPEIPAASLSNLAHWASESTRGRVRCFGRWPADFGNPIDWHRDPINEHRWSDRVKWQDVLRNQTQPSDIKFVWEIGRFPQAYLMARSAAFAPDSARDLASSFYSQVRSFLQSTPPGFGVHWNSGQEMVFRIMAWLFAIHVFSPVEPLTPQFESALSEHLLTAGMHIYRNIEYARDSVYNNHLLSEALGLHIVGKLLPTSMAQSWSKEGLELLTEQAERQIYPDGSYIQQSHNYHRVAMQTYLWAAAFALKNDDVVPREWIAAMERSLDFLHAHENPDDGRLPNYGANDGSHPVLLSTCDFSDFRPTLQALSIVTRGERIYHAGPWDEMSMWLFGPRIAELPFKAAKKRTTSFSHTGHHVLRGKAENSFGTFRCGTILDRFSQIDMLHLDLWWRGQNVLADPGSYLYNGPREWHDHFTRTEGHNTVQVDGHDQMLHYRQFKCLYWTQAKLLTFEDNQDWAICEGEHYGFERHSGHCVHKRSVLFLKDDVTVVVDTVMGEGVHNARLQWLGGDFPYEFDRDKCRLGLATPAGSFYASVVDSSGRPCSGEVVAGGDDPKRGWLARYYGEKVPVPSLVVSQMGQLPTVFVSVLSHDIPELSVTGTDWAVETPEQTLTFRIDSGSISTICLQRRPVPAFQ